MANVPIRVIELVETFDRNIEAYKNQQYKEAQLCREFIDPFFHALGWDVANEKGYAPAYKDVIHEDAIKIGGYTKAPDYCFRIGETRKFFLEAKKPSIDIKGDPHPAYQLRRYAWSAKLPLSILTDFEEFAVYDCQIRPKQTDKSGTARIMYYTYKDYIDNWDKIETIFSKDAIKKGSFDKFAAATKGKRGTATVDKEFLAEIEKWREMLARTITIKNISLSRDEINFAVQRTIDRILFLRMCEDRGIERYQQLLGVTNGRQIYPRLCQLFRQADAKYNSGLFHFRHEKGRAEGPDELTLTLVIDDTQLGWILRSLYYPGCPYEFSVLPAEILGNVYEQFLGKVIRITPGHQAKIEEKPKVKKAGGVYYTPSYIVDYIVKNTVGKLCEGKDPKQISKLKILDPACGSGSFLLGAYTYLLNYHRDWYVQNNPKKHTKQIYQGKGAQWFLTIAEKKRILLSNIFGVDIDSQAVEVTKLSLLLKVLEGETSETIGQTYRMFHERALPDLGNNIKCGNSLIGHDFFDDYQRLAPAPVAGGSHQTTIPNDLYQKINPFDWEAEFPQIFSGKNLGFDAVIGNPPYIRIQRIGHEESDYLFAKYKTPASKTDLSQLFLERSLILANKTAIIGFICTSQWIATDYGKNMRRVLSNGVLHEIVDFGSLPVFQKASTYPAIFILSPSRAKSLRIKKITSPNQLNLSKIEQICPRQINLENLSEKPWNLAKLDIPQTLDSHGVVWEPLQAFGNTYIGVLTGMDAAFVLPKSDTNRLGLEDEILLPYAYKGKEVVRYQTVTPSSVVIYPYTQAPDGSPVLIPENDLRRRCPYIFKYLVAQKSKLCQRKDSRRLYATGSHWYRHLRPGSFKYIMPKKLIIKGIDKRTVVGLLDQQTCFNGANCPAIILDKDQRHLELYILGIMNSKLVSFHLRSICPSKLSGYTRFNAKSINGTPIRTIDFDSPQDKARHDKMVKLVERMLDLNKKLAAAKVPAEKTRIQRQINTTDSAIDKLVYELYDLTKEEIAIVEGKK